MTKDEALDLALEFVEANHLGGTDAFELITAIKQARSAPDMSKQPEALRLADQIHTGNGQWMQEAAAELRRLYAEVERGEPVANASAWFALVMNAAAELEDASHCLRDEDAKRVAISGAKHYRDAANALYTTPPAAPVQEPVAWMFEFPDKRVKPKFDSAPHGGNWQPLYTHPQPDAYGYAKRLAEAIWKKHYQSTAPQWEPFDHLIGVLTQIDNMTSGLTTPPNVATPPAAQRQSARSAWVGLTDDEIIECTPNWIGTLEDVARAIEAKLKEKNT